MANSSSRVDCNIGGMFVNILDYADDVVLFFSTVVALVTASVRY